MKYKMCLSKDFSCYEPVCACFSANPVSCGGCDRVAGGLWLIVGSPTGCQVSALNLDQWHLMCDQNS